MTRLQWIWLLQRNFLTQTAVILHVCHGQFALWMILALALSSADTISIRLLLTFLSKYTGVRNGITVSFWMEEKFRTSAVLLVLLLFTIINFVNISYRFQSDSWFADSLVGRKHIGNYTRKYPVWSHKKNWIIFGTFMNRWQKKLLIWLSVELKIPIRWLESMSTATISCLKDSMLNQCKIF